MRIASRKLDLPLRSACVAMATPLLTGAIACAGTQHFNVSDDFSTTQNPSGTWSCTEAGSPITATLCCYDTLQGWGYYSSYDASISKAMGPPSAGWFDAAAGDVIIHVASEQSGYPGPMALVWTAPEGGYVSITGHAWDAYFLEGRDAGWTLSHNKNVLASHGTIYGIPRTDAAASFGDNIAAGQNLTNLPVSQGDVITFSTHATTFFGHFMGVEIDIDLVICPADISPQPNGNGVVNVADLLMVINNWGPCPTCPADINGDGATNVADLLAVINGWGACP